MTGLQILGACLLAAPFVVIGAVAIRELGLRATVLIFSATAGVGALVYVGALLITGDLS